MDQNETGVQVGLGPDDFVLDGDPASPPQKGCGAPSPIFGPCLLWTNGWMDQHCTWRGSGHWFRPHCARWGPSSPPQKRGRAHPQFSAHLYCGQTAGCIKIPVGLEVGLSPGDFVLDGDPAPSPKGGGAPNLRPMSVVAKWLLDGLRYATGYGGRPRPRRLCVRWGPTSLPEKRAHPLAQFLAHVYCGRTAGWIKMPLGTEVNLGPGDVVLDGVAAPPKKGTAS